MRTQIYSIFDTVALVYNKPFTEHNDESAKRAFQSTATDQPNYGDYSLYNVGEWDDSTGIIISMKEPVLILQGKTIKPSVTSITPEMQEAELKKA